jgi:hypothetical protein
MRQPVVCCLLILLFTSCSKQNNSEQIGLLQIENAILREGITDYVKTNHVDLKQCVVTVVLNQNDSTESYLLTTTRTNPFAFSNKPFAYSKSGDAWVIFFNKRGNPFTTKNIEKSFLYNTEKEGVKLLDRFVFYDPKYVMLEISAHKKVRKRVL